MTAAAIALKAVDGPGDFWRVIGQRAVGTAVVATADADGPRGFLALSPTHLSASPPMMMVSVDSKTSALAPIRNSKRLTINYLSARQDALVPVFGGKTELAGGDRFDPSLWETLPSGMPALIGAVCVIDCEVSEMIDRFGATIVIARIEGAATDGERAPHISYRGRMLPLAQG